MGRKKITEKYFMMRLDGPSEKTLKILSQNAGKSQAAIIRQLLALAGAAQPGMLIEPAQKELIRA